MIRFRCHRCKRPIAAPDGHVGKKVKCPGCMIVTIVPDIPGAQAAKEKALRPPRSAAAPPVPQGPPDPLDELAAAVEGDVQTATFDDEYTAYEQVETYDDFQATPPSPREAAAPSSRTRKRKFDPSGKEKIPVGFILLLIGVILASIIGVVIVLMQQGEGKTY